MNKTLKQLVMAAMATSLIAVAGCTNDGEVDESEVSETTSEMISEASETISEASEEISEAVSEEESEEASEEESEADAATYGAAGALADASYTLEEMLTYAIQDEYMAQAKYEAIAWANDDANPFANISEAEVNHINELIPLFAQEGLELPVNDAADRITVPETLDEAYEVGVEGETDNINMYERFLEEDDLPENVRATFERLMAASEEHLAAFEQENVNYGNDAGNNPN